MEFDQVVPYEFGDDVRDIDWNVTAKLGEPYRKKFIEEREVTILLIFEDSPSLQFGSVERTKREALLEWAALIALLATMNRDRFSILYAGPQGTWFEKPARSRGTILYNTAKLMEQPEVESSSAPVEIPWKFIARAVPRNSMLIWMGDFPPGSEPESWPAIRKRYQTLGMRIDDPWERALPEGMGALCAFDPVTQEMVLLDPTSSRDQQRHQQWKQERDSQFQKLFPDPYGRLALSSEADLLDGMVQFFKKRMIRRVH